MTRVDLAAFVHEAGPSILEDEALAALANRFVTPEICGEFAQNPHLTSYYSVRVALVAHQQTPRTHAIKLVHYLYWFDLLRLSINVQVPAPVRRAIETQLLLRVQKLTLGERIASARQCSAALIPEFLFDPNPNVFEALLVNKRLREDDILSLVTSTRATREQLQMLAEDPKWSYRYGVRKALVMNERTPRSVAASHLRHLSRRDLQQIHANPATSVYVRRCIERLGAVPTAPRAD